MDRVRGIHSMIVALIALAVAVVGPAQAVEPARIAASKVSQALKLSKKAQKDARSAKRIAKRADARSKQVSGQSGPQGQKGEMGDDGEKGDDGSPDTPAQVLSKVTQVDGSGSGLDSDSIDGIDSAGILSYGSEIPSGVTIKGAWADGFTNDGDNSGDAVFYHGVSFPTPAPVALTDVTVNFKPGTIATDDDATCTGTGTNPTAPAGKVCLYLTFSVFGTDELEGRSVLGSKFGFYVRGKGSDKAYAGGTWAYTAP